MAASPEPALPRRGNAHHTHPLAEERPQAPASRPQGEDRGRQLALPEQPHCGRRRGVQLRGGELGGGGQAGGALS